jgi:hypothetical protein
MQSIRALDLFAIQLPEAIFQSAYKKTNYPSAI